MPPIPAVNLVDRVAPIYVVAIAIVTGDALGNFHVAIPLWLEWTLALVALVAFLRSRRTLGLSATYLAIVIAANVAVANVLEPPRKPHGIATMVEGSRVAIEGRVYRETEHEAYGDRIYVKVARAAEQGGTMFESSGNVRIAVLGFSAFKLGDEIRLTARIHFPRNYGNPGEFDYVGLMARDGIDGTMTAPKNSLGSARFQLIGHRSVFPGSEIESIRAHIGGFFDRNLAYPENAEMRALVIGDQGEIGDPLRQMFARTGMAHLLVISGLHLSIVAAAMFAAVRLAMMLLPGLANRGYANKVAAVAAMIAVCAYASIAGHHVSTVRALTMVLAYMSAVAIDRSREAIASLALAAIVICVALPGSTADIGFQLSFASVIAIVLGMRRCAAWFARRKRLGLLRGEPSSLRWRYIEAPAGYLAVSFWAMVGTAPLTAYHFNQFAVVGIVANALVMPIMAFGATISGLVAAALSFFSESAARPILLFGASALAAGNWLAAWFVDWPLAWFRIFTPTILELTIAYALLATWLLAPLAVAITGKRSRDEILLSTDSVRGFGWRGRFVIALAAVLTIDAGYWIYDRFFNPDLRVTFLSVGEGDGAVVRFPGSRVMLIDGGGSYGGFDAGERIVAPYLWSQKIMRVDYIVLSHPDLDHFGGLDFIAMNFAPRAFWTTGVSSLDVSYSRFMDDLERARVPMVQVLKKSPVADIGGVSISSLNGDAAIAKSHNNSSMVLRFSFGSTSLLFTGDIESAGERALIENRGDLQATILKVPHHGSATSSTAAFIAAVHPEAAVISDGYLNNFHFPAAAVVERYVEAGAILMRTDLDGAVMVDASPNRMTVRTFRGRPGSSIRIVHAISGAAGH
ncbi:DNA internalization-related competence protein ComEC/Rec2 [Candidatus Binatus sp.]|uniref:DNA internalization-related competence protein ComEC/Rec2 n=1 Tax=Candidatus Binatus sp. TaxID=2811406 RepID=UPI003BAFAC8D